MAQSAGLLNILTSSLPTGKNPTNECPGYNTKQSDSEAPVMQELLRMRITPSLQSLSCPLWPWLGAPGRVLSFGRIEPFDIQIEY